MLAYRLTSLGRLSYVCVLSYLFVFQVAEASSVKKDYYEVLSLPKGASSDEIKKAYRKMAVKYHPDKLMNAPESERKMGEEKFKELGEAYEVLGNEESRQRYDEYGHSAFAKRPHSQANTPDLDELIREMASIMAELRRRTEQNFKKMDLMNSIMNGAATATLLSMAPGLIFLFLRPTNLSIIAGAYFLLLPMPSYLFGRAYVFSRGWNSYLGKDKRWISRWIARNPYKSGVILAAGAPALLSICTHLLRLL